MGRPGQLRPVPPLPRKLRARLWCDHRVDQLASRLVAHGHWRAAIVIWKAYGAW